MSSRLRNDFQLTAAQLLKVQSSQFGGKINTEHNGIHTRRDGPLKWIHWVWRLCCLLADEERAAVVSDGAEAPTSERERHFDRFWNQRKLLPAETFG